MMVNEPHGGKLCNLMADPAKVDEIKREASSFPSLTLNSRHICDLELLLNGAFSPLNGFMGEVDYQSVLKDMRLGGGVLWPMPIVLDVSKEAAGSLKKGEMVGLRDPEGVLLAVIKVTDLWSPDKAEEAQAVYGTTDTTHPGVAYLMKDAGEVNVGGEVTGVEMPHHYDFAELRHTPQDLRSRMEKANPPSIVAFQTRNPMHRAHQELTLRAAKQAGGHLLIQPVVGMTKPGDIDHFTRVRCYRKLLPRYPEGSVTLSLLPLSMRMAGPREALWHALIRKNYGATHFIVGRDHAGPGSDSKGKPFYGPYDAQEMVSKFSDEIGINMVPFRNMVYAEGKGSYFPEDEVPKGEKTLSLSGTRLRSLLEEGGDIPEWFTYKEIAEELRVSCPPRHMRGFTVFFTGLSGSGKSTIAKALQAKLMETESRNVTLLDGDVVRLNLSKGLDFSKEGRAANIRRIGYVASEITRNGGICLCAPIAPYEEDREHNRRLIASLGGFVEIFVSTPIETCEKRDRKGLYAKARKGIIKGFTGIDDPYEKPEKADIEIDTTDIDEQTAVNRILEHLRNSGYLRG